MATATKSKQSSKKSSKRTNEKHRKILRSARDGLVKEMNLDDVLPHMAFREVLSKTDEEEIKDEDLTRQQQCEKFLDMLEWKGAKAFNSFVEAIEKVQPYLAYLLTDIKEERKESTKLIPSDRLTEVKEQNKEFDRENTMEQGESTRLQRLENKTLSLEEDVRRLKELQGLFHDRLGLTASHPQEERSKRTIFADIVTEEGTSWTLKKTGVCIEFPPKAMPSPKLVTSSLWRPSAVSLPLNDDELLVSNVIELGCDNLVGIDFSKVTVTLSHSAIDLKGYEMVIKERIDQKKNDWRDLKTSFPDPLHENSESPSDHELRFVQANITSFSMYAVICRLKSYKFSRGTMESNPEFTCTVQEYPDVSVTVPSQSLSSNEEFSLTMKVQQVQNDGFEERNVFVTPVLHISCSMEVEFEEPVTIRIPITLEQDQMKLPDLSNYHIGIFYQNRKRKMSQEWVEITSELKTPAKLENGVVSFQVNHFSRFNAILDFFGKFAGVFQHLYRKFSVPQSVGFLACLCKTPNPEEHALILSCFPIHMRMEIKMNIASSYKVELLGEGTSVRYLNKGDEAFFTLSEELTPSGETIEDTFLRFLGHLPFQASICVRAKMKTTPSIKFFKKKKDTEGEETLCTLSIILTSPLEEARSLTSDLSSSQDIPCKKRDANTRMRRKVVEQALILPIVEELGSCWKTLGTAIGLTRAKLHNIGEDYKFNREKATSVLQMWMDEKGNDATVGLLVDVLEKIGKKSIADTLLTLLGTNDSEVKDKEGTTTNCSYDRELGVGQDEVKGQQDQVEVSKVIEDEVKKKEEEIQKLTSKLNDERKRTLELEQKLEKSKILEEQHANLEEESKKNEKVIQELTKKLTSEQGRAKELEQKVEESQILDDQLKSFQKQVKVKDETIHKLSSELKSEQDRTKELEQKIEESHLIDEQLQEQKTKETETIKTLTSQLKDEQNQIQQLKQQIEESRIIEDEYKSSQDKEIKRLSSELEEAKKKLDEESGVFVDEYHRLDGEVKKKDEIIKKLSNDLEYERKQVKELKKQVHESTIVEEELKRPHPR